MASPSGLMWDRTATEGAARSAAMTLSRSFIRLPLGRLDLFQQRRDVEAPFHGIVHLEGEFRRVPEAQGSAEVPPQESRRRPEAFHFLGETALGPWAREEHPGMAEVHADAHRRDGHLMQPRILDLAEQDVTQLFLDQAGHPVGALDRLGHGNWVGGAKA